MRMRLSGRLALVALLAACAGSPMPPPVPVAREAGILGPGDVFEVRVYGEPEMSGVYRLAEDYTIDFPLLSSVDCKNTTATSLAGLLTERLKRYVKEPHVSVYVKEFNSQKIYVFGQVQRPGTFKFEEGMSVVEAITLAGGFAKLADENGTSVTRLVNGRETRLKIPVADIGEGKEPNVILEPGDIVYVPESLL